MPDYSQEPVQSRVEYLLRNGGGGGGGSSADVSALTERVIALENALSTLTGQAPESFNTLKEIADWIADNEITTQSIQDSLYWTKYSA